MTTTVSCAHSAPSSAWILPGATGKVSIEQHRSAAPAFAPGRRPFDDPEARPSSWARKPGGWDGVAVVETGRRSGQCVARHMCEISLRDRQHYSGTDGGDVVGTQCVATINQSGKWHGAQPGIWVAL